jgi:hypothetical protein
MELRLRPWDPNDEASARAGHDIVMADDFNFLLYGRPEMEWSEFLIDESLRRRGDDLSEDQVRSV